MTFNTGFIFCCLLLTLNSFLFVYLFIFLKIYNTPMSVIFAFVFWEIFCQPVMLNLF